MNKKLIIVTFILIVGLCVGARSSVYAQSNNPIGVALFQPVQFPDSGSSVTGIRLNIVYGQHRNLTGIDLGLINRVNNHVNGFQLGLFNGFKRSGSGIQLGVVNHSGSFNGLQIGAMNRAYGHVNGWQTGIYNQSRNLSGLQFGLINYTNKLNGVQVGLGNFNLSPGKLPEATPTQFFPFVNWSF